MFNWLETMGEKHLYDERKSKCDKRKKRNVYRTRRRCNLNGSKRFENKEDG